MTEKNADSHIRVGVAGDESAGGLTFVREGGGLFQIGPTALTTIRAHAQHDWTKPEAAGVLLGRHLAAFPHVIVDAVTVPMRGDRATRTRYYRARGSHQAAIDRAWAESGGTCTYLGEWHTHPERAPSPSPEDLADWRRKLTVDRYSGFLFFVIAGTEETFAWEGRHGAEVVALALR